MEIRGLLLLFVPERSKGWGTTEIRSPQLSAASLIVGWFRMMERDLQRGAGEPEETQCVGMAKT
jgi:hypothetical protein